MTLPHLATSDELARHASAEQLLQRQSDAGPGRGRSICWAAIFGGAAGAAALSLILLMLGVGLGLSSVSPWSLDGLPVQAIGTATIVWLAFTQLAASGMGGYLAGRLRPRWWEAQSDEVYFRDTAHGFLAWAVASLATAALLGSAIGAITGRVVQAGAAGAGAAATAAVATTAASGIAEGMGGAVAGKPETDASPAYFVDSLFRQEPPAAAPGSSAPAPLAVPPSTPAPTQEALRIFAFALRGGALPAADADHLARLVSQRTGAGPNEARERVNQTFERFHAQARQAENSAREAADQARKASAHAALWLFVSLLGGAFVASLMATFGGRQRDEA